jgi:protein-disulfide isomerase
MARLAVLALGVDVWLTGVQAFALRSFCLFCVFTYVCTAAHLALNWAMAPKDRKKGLKFLRSDKRSKIPPFALAGTFGLVAACAVGLYSLSTGIAPRVGSEEMKRAFLASWDSLPSSPISVRDSDGQWGNPQAKVRLVLFSDFECPHCQRAAFAVQTALASEKDRVHLIFKHFPLDMSCNPLLTQPIHANSCVLAQLGQCAQKKGKFWDYHDRVFFKLSARELSSTRDKIWEGVRSVFTREEFDRCLTDPEALANVQSDIQQGNALGVTSTPSVFINGKKVSFAPTVDLLRELVMKELD